MGRTLNGVDDRGCSSGGMDVLLCRYLLVTACHLFPGLVGAARLVTTNAVGGRVLQA